MLLLLQTMLEEQKPKDEEEVRREWDRRGKKTVIGSARARKKEREKGEKRIKGSERRRET